MGESPEETYEKYVRNPLWPILVETVHYLSMYPHHKAYVYEKILPERPDITPRELSVMLGITFGEALVLLYELRKEKSLKP
ncbi:hypothetical protein CW702_01520 [Candidatus Bathyarchaeota archaeon]|nr:MAG: hypothetical protein CW702_01520 [Candidatus Bathyarchaeota archaeon]